MKKVLILLSILAASLGVATFGVSYYREVLLIKQSGLNLSRFSLTLLSHDERTMRLGAEGRSVFEFELPSNFRGLTRCGRDGYSQAKKITNLNEIMIAEEGCFYNFNNNEGSIYKFILTERKIIVFVIT
ncbi:hypothetical protein [Pelagibius sp. Alg239-R121]|uniref:hypothetical protein n=1 Tax=Pelagibius sp. Alg239-R121 TaxID=2993448 RepID=UPI0024A63A68|nr:hypothetical protein [Pelagibius sp. Alg239-R121]